MEDNYGRDFKEADPLLLCDGEDGMTYKEDSDYDN